MFEICPQEKCTSCFACQAICPVGAIETITDTKGFYRPFINNACVNCGKCQRVCQGNNLDFPENEIREVFASFSRDENIRKQSSSGGIFSLLCAQILDNGGVVFGAAFDSDFSVKHIAVEKADDFPPLRGSKYVQSFIRNSYKDIKTLLDQDRTVLFSGTPCQVAGLRLFLGKSALSGRLFLVDLVCHGAPSPLVYKSYLGYMEKKYASKIKSLSFRDKPLGWKAFGMKITFENGAVYFAKNSQDPYIIGFLKNYFLNQSCYSCNFANTDRVGDLTIADFWGYQNISGHFADDDKGITLVIANNQKGLDMFSTLTDIVSVKRSLSEAVAGNAALARASFKNRRYDEFWLDYESSGFSSSLIEKYLMPK